MLEGMQEDCLGSLGPQQTVMLEEEEQKKKKKQEN
jgi:hypothetical protein